MLALKNDYFPPAPSVTGTRFVPDFQKVHKELQSKKHVTLNLLWQEYKEQHPDGYQYSWFCHNYRDWTGHLDVVMRHEHRAFIFFGGVPEVVVPDNLKSGVTKACLYEPDINPTYNDLARHYETVVIPARVRKPRDKAKAEAGVLLVERWILAKLRNHRFFSLAELDRQIGKLLQGLHEKHFQKLTGSRHSWFEEIDKPALKQLPSAPYELAYWKKATVHLDYHVEVKGYYY